MQKRHLSRRFFRLSSQSDLSFLPVDNHRLTNMLMLGRLPYMDAQGLLVVVTGFCLAALAAGEEGGAAIPNVEGNDSEFNIQAFVIAVREAMEGCVITAILLSTLHKSGQDHLKKYVWFGVLLGTGSFMVVGAVCLTIFYAAGENMPQAARAAFEGVFALLAMFILTHISFKFLRLRDMIHKWQNLLIQKKRQGDEPAAAQGVAAEPEGCWGRFMVYIKDFRDALNIRHQAIDQDALKSDPQGLGWKGLASGWENLWTRDSARACSSSVSNACDHGRNRAHYILRHFPRGPRDRHLPASHDQPIHSRSNDDCRHRRDCGWHRLRHHGPLRGQEVPARSVHLLHGHGSLCLLHRGAESSLMLGSSGLAEGSPARCLRRAHHTKDSNACGALWREQAGLSTYSAVELEQIASDQLKPMNHPGKPRALAAALSCFMYRRYLFDNRMLLRWRAWHAERAVW